MACPFFRIKAASSYGVAASARTSLKDSCGAGKVINERTLSHNGQDIAVTTTSCPGFAALNNTTSTAASKPTKRQSNIAAPCSVFECDISIPQPPIGDCQDLTVALVDLGSEAFLAPSETLTTFTFGKCVYGFANLDVIEYTVLFSNVGESGESLAFHCFNDVSPVFSAGFCLSPGVVGDDWVIEVVHS